MKKVLSIVLSILMIAATFVTAYAVNDTQSFRFELSTDGKNMVEVNKGDVITVVFRLYRTDASESYTMYAMQNEICYDGDFFELMEDSAVVKNDVVFTDIGLVDRHREFYMNYLSMSGGIPWTSDEIVGSVQFRVIAESGVSTIVNQNYLVSTKDGSDEYVSEASDLTVVITSDCTVTFDSNGGTSVPDQVVQFGEKIQEPEAPTREGYIFAGWYKDIYLKDEWDFENDVVEGNMRLYAKWIQQEEPVEQHESMEQEENSGKPVFFLSVLLLIILIAALAYQIYKKKQSRQ